MPRARSIVTQAGHVGSLQDSLFAVLKERTNASDTAQQRTPSASTSATRPISFITLASSSAGNCSVLRHGTTDNHRLTLIDCGLSPRKTRALLAALGTDIDRIDDVILTHLDHDHCHKGWAKSLPSHARFRLYHKHLARARRNGIAWRKTEPFDAPFTTPSLGRVTPIIMAHDELGVAAFRFDLPIGHALGYATDLGRSSPTLERTLAGVHTLAVESNYCPILQQQSTRPDFLKLRITGGAGHLSNDQSAELVRAVRPTSTVVLLHLSRECNSPQHAFDAHAHPACTVIAAGADAPSTDWLSLAPAATASASPTA